MRRVLVCLVIGAVACISHARKGRVNPYTDNDLLTVGRYYVPTGAFEKGYADGDCTKAPHPQAKLFCEKKCDQIVDRDVRALCTGNCKDTTTADWRKTCHVLANETYYSDDACDGIKDKKLSLACTMANRSTVRPTRPSGGGGGGDYGGGGGDGTESGGDEPKCNPNGADTDTAGECCSGMSKEKNCGPGVSCGYVCCADNADCS